jgi:hypothetical protein
MSLMKKFSIKKLKKHEIIWLKIGVLIKNEKSANKF